MKKRILIFALLLTAVSYSFAGTTDGITKKIAASFTKEFSNARDVTWEQKRDFTLATFWMNNQVMFAYYAPDGDLLGVARNIVSDQLPISQSMGLKKNYPGYWITDLFEVSKNGETTYYISLENADMKLVLRAIGNTGWEIYSAKEKE